MRYITERDLSVLFLSLLWFPFPVKKYSLFCTLPETAQQPQIARQKGQLGWGGPTKAAICIGASQTFTVHPPLTPLSHKRCTGPPWTSPSRGTRRETPKERQCQSGFQVYCRHSHTDGTRYPRRVHI